MHQWPARSACGPDCWESEGVHGVHDDCWMPSHTFPKSRLTADRHLEDIRATPYGSCSVFWRGGDSTVLAAVVEDLRDRGVKVTPRSKTFWP